LTVPTNTDPIDPDMSTPDVSHLRRIGGLTWEQIADLFGVSRSAVHQWASGGPIDAAAADHLRNLVHVIDRADRGGAAENREALLTPTGDPPIPPFTLLQDRRYTEAFARLGAGVGRPSVARAPLSAEAAALRRPTVRPEVLIDGDARSMHRDLPGGRPVRNLTRYRGDRA